MNNTFAKLKTSKLEQNISLLSNSELLKLADELKLTQVPEDALIRKVIKNTEVDTTVPMLSFIAVGSTLAQVLAERLKCLISVYEQ